MLRIFCEGLAALLGGVNCSWLCACEGSTTREVFSMEIFDGWWSMDVVDFSMKKEPLRSMGKEMAEVYLELSREHGPGLTSQHAVRHAEATRVHLRQDVMNDGEWAGHWLREKFLEPYLGVGERMLAVYHVGAGRESYWLIDRPVGGEKFAERERELAYLAISGVPGLHRRLFLERGLLEPATRQVSPRERETMGYLLTGKSEKEIADLMGVSKHTAHQYVSSIYRNLQVSGRSGLFSSYVAALG